MSTGRYPSRVFAVGLELHAALSEIAWPVHLKTNRAPSVDFSVENPDADGESITLALNTDETSADWRRLSPAGRDEFITYDVVIRSYVPGVTTSKAVWLRLAELAELVESTVYDATAETMTPLNVDGVYAGLTTGVRPSVFPSGDGSWLGAAEVSFRFQASI